MKSLLNETELALRSKIFSAFEDDRRRTLVLFTFERRSRCLNYDYFKELARSPKFGFEIVDVPMELQHALYSSGRVLRKKGISYKEERRIANTQIDFMAMVLK